MVLYPSTEKNSSSVETMTGIPTSSVNNVQLCCSFSPSHSLFPIPDNVVVSSAQDSPTSSRHQEVPLSSMHLVATTFQQDFVLPSRVTPIDAQKLWCGLRLHPDQVKVNYVITGFTSGFLLGFDPSVVFLKSAVHNIPSASLQPSVIDKYILPELKKGHVVGPFLISSKPKPCVNRFGVIPKKHQPGKWQLILDVSSPLGHSFNDGILKEPSSI